MDASYLLDDESWAAVSVRLDRVSEKPSQPPTLRPQIQIPADVDAADELVEPFELPGRQKSNASLDLLVCPAGLTQQRSHML